MKMKWFNFIVVYLIIAIIFTTSANGKGGRSGGRSSGRGSSSRSSGSGRSWFSSGSSSSSSSSSRVSHSHSSGGGGRGNWFSRIFSSQPGKTTYVPIYRPHTYHTTSYSSSSYADTPAAEFNDDSKTVVAGYSIGKALTSDFYSLFNIVSDISKYTDERKKYAAENAINTMTEVTTVMETKTDQEMFIEATTEQQIPVETTTEEVYTTEDLYTTEDSASTYDPYSNIFKNWDHLYNGMAPLDIHKDLFKSPIETTQKYIISNEGSGYTDTTNGNMPPKYLGIDVSDIRNNIYNMNY